jgi:hypothetical protein
MGLVPVLRRPYGNKTRKQSNQRSEKHIEDFEAEEAWIMVRGGHSLLHVNI